MITLNKKIFSNNTTHIELLAEDCTLIKYLTQDEVVLDILESWRTQIEMEEIKHLLTEEDIKRIDKHKRQESLFW